MGSLDLIYKQHTFGVEFAIRSFGEKDNLFALQNPEKLTKAKICLHQTLGFRDKDNALLKLEFLSFLSNFLRAFFFLLI